MVGRFEAANVLNVMAEALGESVDKIEGGGLMVES